MSTLALSFSHKTAAKAFLVGTSGPIVTEYYWRIQYIRPLGMRTILGLDLSTFLDLHGHLFPQGLISGGAYYGVPFFWLQVDGPTGRACTWGRGGGGL